MNVTEAYVDSLALNSSAIKNGKDLVKKNSFPLLGRSEDGTLIFGECKGSGKEPYRCSVDWIKEGSPVFRCTCPSRQFPCKHNLGLMYAYAAGKPFETAPIPADILEKREKAEKREEKKSAAASPDSPDSPDSPAPKRKTNKSALAKKIAAQLEGIAIAEKLVLQLVQSGLGSVDRKALQTVEDQAKQLGNYYIPGIQTELRGLAFQFRSEDDRESVYSNAMERLTVLQTLIRKGREHLQNRLENPDAPMDTETTLEEGIGHAWQLAELREHGRVRKDAELVQLAFRSYTDQARGEYVDEGFWCDLETGQIHTTRTYRPFRAAKYIREDDSFFQVACAQELFQYPGELNARVRWEEATIREAGAADYAAIRAHARKSWPETIKQVKNQIKNPLSDKHPVMLLYADQIQRTADTYVLIDEQGKRLPLADIAYLDQPAVSLLPMLNREWTKRQAVLVMFEHNMRNNRLEAQPLSIITPNEVIRLLY